MQAENKYLNTKIYTYFKVQNKYYFIKISFEKKQSLVLYKSFCVYSLHYNITNYNVGQYTYNIGIQILLY